MYRLALIATALLTSFACSEYDISKRDVPVDAAQPDIVVQPATLIWGELSQGESETQVFTVSNIGEAPLTIDDMAISAGISFEIMSTGLQLILDPGESKTVEVAFTPMQGASNFGQVLVYSDDPDTPEAPVDLMGEGMVPELKITPDNYDFQATFIPCGADVEIMFENIGREDLVIDGFEYVSGGLLTFAHNMALPITVPPNEAVYGTVTFDAANAAQDFAELTVDSNDPRGLVTAFQLGEGDYIANNDDQFVVPVDPPVDILFAVDQSCSMDTEAVVLGNAFSNFINTIGGVTNGWQIGVTTLQDGCFNYGWMNQYTPNYIANFQDAVTQGSHHSYTEALLQLSDISLSKTGPGQCNAGFLRPGAMLHIIVVSDEPEQSGTNWATWVNTLESYAPNAGLFKISAVVDLGGCGTGAGGYDSAAMATGGELLNICNANWANDVGLLATASLTGLNTFELADTPEQSSIIVTVDGVDWNSGWSFDPATNSIVFADPQFQGGETIDVNYDVVAGC